MTIVNLPEIIVSHAEIFEFGEERFRQTIPAGATVRIPVIVGPNKIRFIYEWKFGNIQVNSFLFRWDNTRNYREVNLLLGTESTNFPVRPFPFLIIKEGGGTIVVQNTTGGDLDFEMQIEFFETIRQFVEDLQKQIGWKDIV